MNKRILITDHVHDHLIDGLTNHGYQVDIDKTITNHDLRRIVDQYFGIVINSKIQADAELQSLGTKLRFIGRLGSGLEIIDLDAAKANGIAVINTPKGNNNAVAEHAIGMLLSLFNNINRVNIQMRDNIWKRESNRGIELEGKTLGIIGFGHTGSQLAKKMQNWDVQILAYDKYKAAYAKDMPWVRETDLAEVQQSSDIISIHLPLTAETTNMINKPFFDQCLRPFYLVNTARGKNIDLSALKDAMQSGKVLGACLDVFPNEKPNSFNTLEQDLMSWFYAQKNVVISPHIAGWTHKSLFKIANILLKKILHLPTPS